MTLKDEYQGEFRKKVPPQNPDRDERGICCLDCGCRQFRVVSTLPLIPGTTKQYKECRNCGRRIRVTVTLDPGEVQMRPTKEGESLDV